MVKTMEKRPVRSEVPEHLTWNLQDLFQSDEEWEKELKQLENDLSIVTKYRGTLSNAKNLLNCLKAYESYFQRANLVAVYASLKFSADGTDPVNQGNTSKISSFVSNVNASLSFIESEILNMSEINIIKFYDEEPELKDFKKFIDDILVKKTHRLSPETEEALAAFSEVHSSPYRIYQISKSSDMQFDSILSQNAEELPMSFALYEDRYEISPDTELRRNAYDSFVKTLNKYKNTFAAAYATEVKKQIIEAKLRKYESVTHMLLQPQQVSLEMYENQLNIIQKELAPHMRKYARLKKKVLGLDEMKFCDLKAPLDPDYNPETSYEEASKLILDALQVMGPEYLEIMKKGLTERWVDLADNVGKSTGAFCSSPYGSHPFILITWTNTMRGTFVLAHELGHAGHFYLAGKYQRLFNTRPSTYFIEAPSTMNELLLGQYLLSNTNDQRMKRWVISQLLGTYYHNFVTHLLEGELQRQVYAWAEKGNPITANVLCEMKGNILKSFWQDEVDIDEGASLTWMRQPHYYMGLYPYTYSAGLTASTAVVQKIQQEGKPAIDRWLEVLKAGGTMKPLELMKHAGVDMSKPDAIRNAVAYVGSLVDQLVESYQ